MNGWVKRFFTCLVVLSSINTAYAGVQICPYYDNRKCAVIWTGDDLGDGFSSVNLNSFAQAVKAAESNKIVFTAGVCASLQSTNGWKTIQQWYTNGAFSVASHSGTHSTALPWDVEYEVAASQSKFIQWMDLPSWNKYKGRQFITAWIQPTGTAPAYMETEFRRQLGLHYYLIDRMGVGSGADAGWDSTNGLFNRITGNGSELYTLATNNAIFDTKYAAGQVYHMTSHPDGAYPITNGSPQDVHMKYIGGRKDVWYSGFEYVYTYKYLQSINPPQIIISTSDTQQVVFKVTADGAARAKYGLSYPLTYSVSIPTNWTGVYVFYSDPGSPVPQQMIEKTTNDFFNGLNVFRKDIGQHVVYVSQAFPEYHDTFQVMVLDVNGDEDGDGIPNYLEPNGTDMLVPR